MNISIDVRVRARSANPNVLSFENISPGPFKDHIRSLMGDYDFIANKIVRIVVQIPDYINPNYRHIYMKGLEIYLGLSQISAGETSILQRKPRLDPEMIFATVLVGYVFDDLTHIQRVIPALSTARNRFDNKYYWIHLSVHEDIFKHAFESALYRRRICENFPAVDLSRNNRLRRDQNIPADFSDHMRLFDGETLAPLIAQGEPRRGQYIQHIDRNPALNLESLPLSFEERLFMEEILSLRLVIGGSFVDHCINRKYTLVPVADPFFQDENGEENLRQYYAGNASFFSEYLGDSFGNLTPYERMDLAVFVAVYHLKLKRGRLSAEELEFRKEMKGYPFRKKASQFTEYFCLTGDSIQKKVLLLPRTVNVFTIGKDISGKILDYLKEWNAGEGTRYMADVRHHVSCFVVSFNEIQFRFIKMNFQNASDIFASIDVYCDQAIIVQNKNGENQFIGSESYIHAVESNLCVVNPDCHNKNYIRAIMNAMSRGYTRFIPESITRLLDPGIIARAAAEDREQHIRVTYEQLRTNITAIPVNSENFGIPITQRMLNYLMWDMSQNIENIEEGRMENREERAEESKDQVVERPPIDVYTYLYPLHKRLAKEFWIPINARNLCEFLHPRAEANNFLQLYMVLSLQMKARQVVFQSVEEEEILTRTREERGYAPDRGQLITDGIARLKSILEIPEFSTIPPELVGVISDYFANSIERLYASLLIAHSATTVSVVTGVPLPDKIA